MEQRLLEIGAWLEANGDAIYGTKPWRKTRQFSAGEIPQLETNKEFMTRYDITDYVDRKKPGQAVIEAFFTAKAGDVYAIFPGPRHGDWTLQDIRVSKATKVTALRSGAAVSWEPAANGIRIHFPATGGPEAVRITDAN
jgi:alpha-L-fucosidase